MKKTLLSALLGVFLVHLIPASQGFCIEEDAPNEPNTQVEAGLKDIEEWANNKTTFYVKRVSTIKENLENLHDHLENIINDSSSKRKDRKEAQEQNASLRPILALAKKTEALIFKDHMPKINQIIQDAFNQLDEGTLNDLEGLGEIESQISHLVGEIQSSYADLQEAVDESGLLVKTIK